MKENCNCNDIKVKTPFCININGNGGGSNIIVVSELPDASAAMPNQLYLNKSNNVMFITYDNAVWTTLSATWGYIFGNLLAQTDLIDYINTNVVAYFQEYVEMITQSLDAINNELSAHEGQFIDADNKLTQINGDITTINGRIDGLSTDISGILAQIDTIDTKIETIDGEISVINVNIANVNDRITSIDNSINAILGSIDAINTDMGTIRDSITALSDSTDMRFANVSNQLNTTIENLSDLGATVTSNIQRIYDIETKLATIEAGAEVNVQSDWTLTDSNSDAYIKNKPANFPTIWSMIGGNISDQSDLQTALTELQTNINLNHSLIGTAIVTRVLEDTSNLDTTRLNVRTRNVNTGTETVQQLDLALATATKSGIMPASSFQAIQDNAQAIESLQHIGRRYPTSEELPETLTQDQVLAIFQSASGHTDPEDNDTIVSINENTRNAEWSYFLQTNSFVYKGITAVNVATNDKVGIVKGDTTAGKVFVEQDGTMSLVGYDQIIDNDNNMSNDITNLGAEVDTNTSDISSIRSEQTTQNNRLNALDTKTNQTNTDVSNLSARVTSNEGRIDNKLDKVTTGAGTQLYTKNADGTQGMTNLASSVTGNSIPLRSAAGTVRTGDPIDVTDSVNLRYLQQYYTSTTALQSRFDNKLDKVTTVTSGIQLYAKSADGQSQIMASLSNGTNGNTVPIRATNGQVRTSNPVESTDAVNLGYLQGNYTASTSLIAMLGGKVDKVAGKDLSSNDYTTAEKEKLAGLLNYTHPAGSALSTGMYRITTNNTGHIIGAIAVTKQDIVNLGIPAQDTVTTSSTTGTGNAVTSISHSNGQIIATKGANFLTTDKIQLVTQLPANPDPTVLYLIPE